MPDRIAALTALLKADGATAALAGARVFGGELPAAEARHMPRHAIVLTPSGGASLTGDTFVEHDTGRVDLFAYGPTPAAAEQLLAVAALAFRRARRKVWAGVLVHWVKPAGGTSGGRDPDAAWPRAFQSFQVFNSLTGV